MPHKFVKDDDTFAIRSPIRQEYIETRKVTRKKTLSGTICRLRVDLRRIVLLICLTMPFQTDTRETSCRRYSRANELIRIDESN